MSGQRVGFPVPDEPHVAEHLEKVHLKQRAACTERERGRVHKHTGPHRRGEDCYNVDSELQALVRIAEHFLHVRHEAAGPGQRLKVELGEKRHDLVQHSVDDRAGEAE